MQLNFILLLCKRLGRVGGESSPRTAFRKLQTSMTQNEHNTATIKTNAAPPLSHNRRCEGELEGEGEAEAEALYSYNSMLVTIAAGHGERARPRRQ